MKKTRAKTHQEVMKHFLENESFQKGYEEELEKLRIVDSLIQLRVKRGLTQSALAQRMGVSQPFIAKLEAGETYNFRLGTLVKFAGALGSEIEVKFRPKLVRTA